MKGRRLTCAADGCTRWVIKGPSRRVAIGWFFDRDGTVLCPRHLPDELAEFMAAKP